MACLSHLVKWSKVDCRLHNVSLRAFYFTDPVNTDIQRMEIICMNLTNDFDIILLKAALK